MNSPLIRLVSFDVTRTLVSPSSNVGAQYAQVASKYLGVTYDSAVLDQNFKKIYQTQKKTHPLFGLNHNMSLEDWWYTVFTSTLQLTGKSMDDYPKIPNTELLRKAFRDVYHNFQWSLIPNALETLKTLKTHKCFDGEFIKTMAVSDSDNRTHMVLSECGLAKYIDVVVTSMDARCCKPDPSIFKFALRKFKDISPEEALHVGDTYDDFKGAKNAGFQALLFVKDNHTCFTNVDKKYTISSLDQVIEHIKHLENCNVAM